MKIRSLSKLKLLLTNIPVLLKAWPLFYPNLFSYRFPLYTVIIYQAYIADLFRIQRGELCHQTNIMQLVWRDSCIFTGLQAAPGRYPGKSARNMLNKRGLKMHPCFTP